MSLCVKEIKTQRTYADTGRGCENSTVLLFLEDGPNGFDRLVPTFSRTPLGLPTYHGPCKFPWVCI